MTPLAIPAKARSWVYGIFGVLSLAVGAIQVGFASVEEPAPVWLRVALAVVPFIGAGIGYTAATHTPKADEYVGEHREPVVVELGAESAAQRDASYPVNISNVYVDEPDAVRRQTEAYRATRPTGPTESGDGYVSGVSKRD